MNLFNHPLYAPGTILVAPRNVGMSFVVNKWSKSHPAVEAIMATADECSWHRSLKTPDGSAPNNSSLASTEWLVPNQVTRVGREE